MKKFNSFKNFILVALLVLICNLVSAQTTRTWSGATSTAWLTATNWGTVPGAFNTTGNNDIAYFNNNTFTGNVINMNNGSPKGEFYLGALNYGTSATTARTLSNSSGTQSGNMYFNGATLNSIANTIIWNQSSTTHTFSISSPNMNFVLNNATNNIIQITGTGGYTIAAPITGANPLTKAGSGTGVLTLSGTNTYTGATTINAGTLSFASIANGGSNSNIGASTNAAGNLVLGGGTLQYTGANASTDRNFTLTAATTSTINTTNTLTISGGAASTSGALTKTGAGGLTLTGTNLYTGLTTVSAGTLTLNKSGGGTIPSTNNVTVTGGTFKVSSNQTINNLTVSSGATVIVDAGVTLTINGTYSISQSNSGGGSGTIAMGPSSILVINQGGWPGNTNAFTYNASATLQFANTSGSYGVGATDTWWPSSNGPANVNVSGAGGMTLNVSRTIPSGGLMQTSATTNIASGVTLTMNGTFQINQGGWGGNTGTYTYGATTGTLVFNNTSGPYGVNGTDTWWPASNGPYNVTVQGGGGITMNVARTVPTTGTTGTFLLVSGTNAVQGTALTLNGTTQINGGNFQTTPTYGSSSTLIYNTSYGISNEWTGNSTTAGSGVPNNVTIQNSAVLTFPNSNRGCASAFNIASGGATLNATSGDLYVAGNFTNNGTFTHNTRAVFLNGTTQTLGGSNINGSGTTNCFPYLILQNGTNVTLAASTAITNTLTLTSGKITLSTFDLNMGSSAISGASSSNYIVTNSTGQLKRTVTSSAVLFPVGNSAYNPLTLTNSGTSDTYGIIANDGTVPNAIDDTKAVNRYWAITEAVAGSGNLSVTAQFNTADGAGVSYSTATNPQFIGLYPNSSPWTQQSSGAAASGSNPYTVSTSGFTNSLPSSGSTYYFAVGNSGAFSSASPPTITASGGVVTSSPGSGTSGYVGNTVTINGTNLNTVTVVKVGGSGGTTVSILSQTATTLTFAAINLGGQIYVQNTGGNATSTESYTNLGYITTATGAWSTVGTWLGGAVPPSTTTTDVTIAHNVTSTTGPTDLGKLTINGSTTLTITAATSVNINTASTNSGTITNNGTLSTASTYTNSGTITINGTFQINQGGFASGGTWTYGASSTLVYNNTSGPYGSIDAGHTYWPASSGPVNVTVQGGGGINMGVSRTVSGTFLLVTGTNAVQGTALTLNGTTQINGGNFQTTPTYGSASTLIYNSSGTYGISNEWTGNATTAGSGIPFNVTIQNSTTLTFPTTNRGIGGNFNVASGGATLNATSGDLFVASNFTNDGTFTHNTRAVFLNGTTQTLGGSSINGSGTTNCFPFLILQNGTNVTLAASAAVTNTLTLTSGKITLSTFDLILGSSTISGASSSNYIVTNSTGQLKRSVTSSPAVLFPVGNSAYNPLTFTNAGTSDIYGIRVVDGAPANAANPLVTVQRSWYITEGVAGSSDLTPVVAQYSSGEVGVNYNAGITPYMGLYNGTSWSQVGTTLGGSITATSTGTNQFPATIPAGSYIAIGKDAGLTSTPPTISSFTSTSGYSGSSIVITGTNFTGATDVSFGGTSAASFTVDSPTQITAVVGSGGASGNVMVTTPSGSVSLAGFTYLGFITTSGATNWNTGSSWLGGAVPTANSAVTIAHNISIAAAFTNSPIASLTVNTGITATASTTVAIGTVTNAITTAGTGAFTFTGASSSIIAGSFVNGGTLSWSAAATLNISAGGTLTNNGTFTRGTGTVNFVGSAGTINGSNAIAFNNLTINSGGLTLTTVPTIDGTLQLNGGFVSASPIYTANSTLYYNLSYNRFNEWSATGAGTIGTTAGYPNNVTINAGTFDIVNGSNTARALNGTLTVNTGATFNVNALNAALTIGSGLTTVGTGTFNMGSTSAAVTVAGAVSNAGSLTLSSTSGGDLNVAGNFTNNGTFTHNTRAVFLNGTTQTISGSALNTSGTTNCFDYLFIQNNSQVSLGAAVAIRSNLTFTSGDIILSTFNLTLASGATITGASSSNYVITNNTGMLVRTLATSTAVTFPIGNSAYNPITISQSGASDVYSFRTIDGSISGLSPYDVTRTINRNWSANRTSSSNVNITVSSISYNTGEENNATNFNGGTQPYYGLYNGTSWVQATATQAAQTFTSANSVVSSTATSFSIALGKDLALVTPSLAVITTTTASSITNTIASSGGTSISDGGGTISAKGVVVGTSANPTTASNFLMTSDGTGTGNFSSSLTGLSPETQYNYRAYATNQIGAAYGSNLTFRTLSNPATVQASTLVGTGAPTSITLTWNTATFPVSGATKAGYVIVYSTSTPTLSSTNGTSPTAGVGTLVTITPTTLPSTPGLTTTISGLTSGTTYNFLLVPFTYDGTNAATYNYLTASAPTTTTSTLNPVAGLQVSATNTLYRIDFDNTVSGVNNGQFAGTGFQTSPTSGRLNSNAWANTGWSDGPLAFGGSNTVTGDFARGASSGGVSTGGIYAFTVETSNIALGFQPGGSDWAPGTITLRIQNQTGSTLNSLSIGYKLWVRNDQGRSSSFNLSHSTDNSSYTNETDLNFTSATTADGSPTWKSYYRVIDLSSLNIPTDAYYYLRWSSADVAGSGSRDELALDDIMIVANPSSNTSILSGTSQEVVIDGNAELSSNLTTANLNIISGNLEIGSNTLTLNGSYISGNVNSLVTTLSSNLVLNVTSSGPFSLPNFSSIGNLTINSSGQNYNLTSSPTISGTLTLTAGNLALGSNTLTLSGPYISGTANNLLTTSSSNLVFNCSGSGPFTLPAFTTLGGLTINSSGQTYNLNSSPTISGSLNLSNGTLAIGARTLTYSGSSISKTSGVIDASNASSSVVFTNSNSLSLPTGLFVSSSVSNLTLNGGGLSVGEDIQVPNTLTMTTGNINFSAGELEIGSGIANPGSIAWTAGTVTGPLKRWFGTSANATQASGIFPVGTSTYNRYAQINFTESTPGGYLVINYVDGTPSNAYSGLPFAFTENSSNKYIQNADEDGYWEMTPYSESGVAYGALDDKTYDLYLRINNPASVQNGGILANPPGVRLIRAKGHADGSHDDWAMAGTYTATTPYTIGEDYKVGAGGVVGFSWFNGGGDNQNPLPVELLSFTGNCENDIVTLNWSTASEHQSSYFEVEKSRNGTDWTVVKTITSAGYSTEKLDYSFTDDNSKSIESYYRLRQVDENGESETFNTILLSCDVNSDVFKTLPNPSASSFQVLVSNKSLVGKSTINMVDTKGTIISTMNVDVVEGVNVFFLDEDVPPGIYFIQITNGKNSSKIVMHCIK